MPARPQSPSQRLKARSRELQRTMASRVRRIVLRILLVLLLAPAVLLLAYRFVPVPITPLMVIRAAEGEGLKKQWVAFEQIAPSLREAVIAAEDNLFCEHRGFDWQALREEVADWYAGRPVRGASTITMQTAKNLFLWPERSMVRKALEALITPEIELLWSKRRILEVYLNIAEFGPGVYGAEAAARTYFAKGADELTQREAALLAAVLPNPRERSPIQPSEYIAGRARTIQARIEQLGPLLDCTRSG